MTQRRFLAGSLVLGFLAAASGAAATTEPPTHYDARAAAMGGTAVSHVHSGAAVYHNVAALHEVKKLVVTLDLATSMIGLSAPLTGPNTSTDSESTLVPLYLVGVGYRLSPQFVLGLASYATGGFGAEYKIMGQPGPKVTLGALEVSPAVEFSPAKNFGIGVGYRITHMIQSARFPSPDPTAPPGTFIESDASGTNFAGFHVGAYFRPMEQLRLGLAYRSKVTTTLEEESTVMGATVTNKTKFSSPHGFKLGAAYEVTKPLLVALELRYLMHKDANKEIPTETTVTTPMGSMTTTSTQTLDWKDSVTVGLGGEYHVTEMVPVRLGYSLCTSATPEERPGPFYPSPGIIHGIHAGAGIELPSWAFDLGGYYAMGSKDVTIAGMPMLGGPIPGTYKFSTLALSLSATYRM